VEEEGLSPARSGVWLSRPEAVRERQATSGLHSSLTTAIGKSRGRPKPVSTTCRWFCCLRVSSSHQWIAENARDGIDGRADVRNLVLHNQSRRKQTAFRIPALSTTYSHDCSYLRLFTESAINARCSPQWDLCSNPKPRMVRRRQSRVPSTRPDWNINPHCGEHRGC